MTTLFLRFQRGLDCPHFCGKDKHVCILQFFVFHEPSKVGRSGRIGGREERKKVLVNKRYQTIIRTFYVPFLMGVR